jgi:hypothetical protein
MVIFAQLPWSKWTIRLPSVAATVPIRLPFGRPRNWRGAARFKGAKNSSRHRLPSHWARGSDLALTNLEDPVM